MSNRLAAVNRSLVASRDNTPSQSQAASRAPSREALNCEGVAEAVISRLLDNDGTGSTNANHNTNLLAPLTPHDERVEMRRGWYNSTGNLTSSDSTPSSDNTTDSGGPATDPSPLSEPLARLGFPVPSNNADINTCLYRMPIVGYEVLEERSRFTVFKIQVFHQPTGDQWFVFRRYTDFVRLNKRLRGEFPGLRFALPPKRWFGDNFDPIFLEDRQIGLQAFIDNIIGHTTIRERKCVRDFFCLDHPPGAHDTLEESRAMCMSLEESVADLQDQLREKDGVIAILRSQVSFLMAQQHTLVKALRLECELKGGEGNYHGSTHDLNVALLNICEKSVREGFGTTTVARRNSDDNSNIERNSVRGNPPSHTVKSPLRRTLEKAFLTNSVSHISLPTSPSNNLRCDTSNCVGPRVNVSDTSNSVGPRVNVNRLETDGQTERGSAGENSPPRQDSPSHQDSPPHEDSPSQTESHSQTHTVRQPHRTKETPLT